MLLIFSSQNCNFSSIVKKGQKVTRRQINIIKRMCAGEVYWSRSSPRITRKDINALEDEGFLLNLCCPHGAEIGAETMYYPFKKDSFKQKAKDLGIID